MSRLIDLVCLCALLACSSIEAARILAVFPTPSISHQVAFRPLTHELARRGHQVVVTTTDPAFRKGQAPENLTEIDTHDMSYGVWRKFIAKHKNGDSSDIIKQFKDFNTVCLDIFEQQAALSEVQDIIQNKNSTFDLLIVEAWLRYILGFSHVVKAPVITMSSFGAVFDNYETMGANSHPLMYPYPQALNTQLYNLTLWEKLNQYYSLFFAKTGFEKLKVNENAVVRRIFGDNVPDLSELQDNIDMLFLNIHPLWDGNRPVPPGVIHIGGIHQKPEKELPQDLKEYLDSSAHGVIYLSFGTNVDTSVLPADKVQTIIKVFSQLPYDVLCKWNQDELPGRTKNVRISKWLPQSDLLMYVNSAAFSEARSCLLQLSRYETLHKELSWPKASGSTTSSTEKRVDVCASLHHMRQCGHPKIKLFITQGGLQSTDETITAGVPVIGIPMLGDQWYNVEKYVHHKIGKQINLADLEEESFKSAIQTVIEDKSYRDNVVRLRTLMYDQPLSSLERAVWWTEHVLRHGGARHLRAPAANMGWAEYYDVQLVLIVLSAAVAVITLGLFVLYQIVTLLRKLSSSVKVKKL